MKAIQVKSPINGMYTFAIVAGSGPANIVEKDFQVKYFCHHADGTRISWTHEEITNAIRNARARIARKAKDSAIRDIGLVKVKGALGNTYYE